eukprot:scaffold15637_cov18-Tisochrysis_lutea.AAC.1
MQNRKPNAHESRSMAQQAEGVAHTAFLVFKVANGSHLTSAHLVFTLRLSYTHPPAHLAQTLLLAHTCFKPPVPPCDKVHGVQQCAGGSKGADT